MTVGWHLTSLAPPFRDESDRERSGKSSNHFRYCIFYTGMRTGTGKAVGKAKSELRDAGNDTIRSEICR